MIRCSHKRGEHLKCAIEDGFEAFDAPLVDRKALCSGCYRTEAEIDRHLLRRGDPETLAEIHGRRPRVEA